MIKSVIFFLFLFISISLSANKNDDFNKKEINFIKELYHGERYFDCIAEIGKLQLYEKNPKLEYFKYINYYLAEQYSTVIFNYRVDLSSNEMRYNSLFLISNSYFKKGLYHESYYLLKDIEYSELPKDLVFTMFLGRIEPLTLLGDSGNIKNEIYKSDLLLRDDLNFIKLREELELYNKAGLKSPGCSAFMSAIIPGSGQIYSGYYMDGIISFLSVAASAAGGLYMYNKGHKGISYTLFFFSGLFYGGNIYSAYNAAEKRNNKTLQDRYKSISSQYIQYNPRDYIDIERTLKPAFSSEKGLIDLAEYHYNNSEYYNSITESMRYQFLYPAGTLFPKSMLIMGKSYYKGGDREKSLNIFMECYDRFTNLREGETALFYSGLIRFEAGSYNFAVKNFLEYKYVYPDGKFYADAIINLSLIYTLTENYDEAEKQLEEFNKISPERKLKGNDSELLSILLEAKDRPKKNLYIAGISSAIIPGAGYFYSENYKLGILSFFTNAALIYGIYDGYKKNNKLQMIFFSVIEFSFYNHSIIGSIRSANDYNRKDDLKKDIQAGIQMYF